MLSNVKIKIKFMYLSRLFTKKIAFNTFIHTSGKITSVVLGMVIMGVLARYLGTSGYGIYTTVLAYLFFFAILADLGLYSITLNETVRSQHGEEYFFNNIFTLRLLSAGIILLLADILVWWLPYSSLIKWGVFLVSISIWLNLLNQLLVAFFQIKLKIWPAAVAEVAGKLLLLGIVVWAVFRRMNIYVIFMAVVASFAFNFFINLIQVRKIIKIRLKFDKALWRLILTKSWPVAIAMIFALLYFKADTLLLSLLPLNPAYHLSNNQAVGIYGAAYKILEVLIAWPAIFMGLVSPQLAKVYAQAKNNEFNRIFQAAFDVLAIIIWPLIIGTLFLAKPLIILIAGDGFLASANVLRVLIWAVGIIYLTHLTTYTIIVIGKQKEIIKFYIGAAFLALLGYVYLIPLYVYWGAAFITVAVELFMLGATFYLLKKNIRLKLKPAVFIKAMLAAIIMGVGLFFAGSLSFFWLILLAIALYLLTLYGLGGLDKKIIKALNEIKE